MSRVRSLAVLGLMVLGCSGSGRGPKAPGRPEPPAVAKDYSASRWIPAKPTYAVAARTVRDAQRGLRDLVESFGVFVDVDVMQVSSRLTRFVAVDPFSDESLSAAGVDLDGGVALFSESVNPTLVVHLSSPAQTQGFVEGMRANGMSTQSVLVDGAEIFTVTFPGKVRLSWVTVDDWLWLHLALPFTPDDGTSWFTSSRRPGAPQWVDEFRWALDSGGAAAPRMVGFFDLRAVIATVSARIPAAFACKQLFDPIGRAAISIDGDLSRATAKLAIDVGAGPAASIARAIRPPPEGWSAVAAQAALGAQWNLDFDVARDWLAPCAEVFGIDLEFFDRFGVRTARAMVQKYDPDKRSNSRGAVSLDLANRTYLAQLLDQIPMRSALERKRMFGPFAGHSISIPFGPTIEYVLDDTMALLGIGEGLLSSVAGKGRGTGGSSILALDISPPAMPREAWAALLAQIGAPRRFADRLMKWREGHITLAVDGTRLVLSAGGTRQ